MFSSATEIDIIFGTLTSPFHLAATSRLCWCQTAATVGEKQREQIVSASKGGGITECKLADVCYNLGPINHEEKGGVALLFVTQKIHKASNYKDVTGDLGNQFQKISLPT